MRIILVTLAISATLLATITDARAAAPPPDTVGRMKRIILPPEDGIPIASTGAAVNPSTVKRNTSSRPPTLPQAPVLANPVAPAQAPVQSMIDRAIRLIPFGPAGVPPGLQ